MNFESIDVMLSNIITCGLFFPLLYTKIPLMIFNSLKKHGLKVKVSFYLGLLGMWQVIFHVFGTISE